MFVAELIWKSASFMAFTPFTLRIPQPWLENRMSMISPWTHHKSIYIYIKLNIIYAIIYMFFPFDPPTVPFYEGKNPQTPQLLLILNRHGVHLKSSQHFAETLLSAAKATGDFHGDFVWWFDRISWWFHEFYPLVNCHITMGNHHVSWDNPLFLWWFSIVMLVYQRVTKQTWGFFMGYPLVIKHG